MWDGGAGRREHFISKKPRVLHTFPEMPGDELGIFFSTGEQRRTLGQEGREGTRGVPLSPPQPVRHHEEQATALCLLRPFFHSTHTSFSHRLSSVTATFAVVFMERMC